MKKLLKNNLWIPGIVLGVVVGYFYWKYIGCNTGTCPITSKPANSMLYFAVVGGLFLNLFQTRK